MIKMVQNSGCARPAQQLAAPGTLCCAVVECSRMSRAGVTQQAGCTMGAQSSSAAAGADPMCSDPSVWQVLRSRCLESHCAVLLHAERPREREDDQQRCPLKCSLCVIADRQPTRALSDE